MEIKELIKNEELRSYLIEVVKEAIQESKPKRKPRAKKAEVDKTVTEKIYDLYPNQCPVKDCSTGKGSKNIEQINTQIREGYEPVYLLGYVKYYTHDCKTNKRWVKNFKTFLNNLPTKDEIKELSEKGLKLLYFEEKEISFEDGTLKSKEGLPLNPLYVKNDFEAWKKTLF